MTRQRIKLSSDLATLYSKYLERVSKEFPRCADVNRDRARKLDRLRKQRVITVGDLLDRLPRLSPSSKYFGVEVISSLMIQQGIPILLELMSDRRLCLSCACAQRNDLGEAENMNVRAKKSLAILHRYRTLGVGVIDSGSTLVGSRGSWFGFS